MKLMRWLARSVLPASLMCVACEGPEQLNAQPPTGPQDVGVSLVGVTQSGEGRVRLEGADAFDLRGANLGLRAKLSFDGGATFTQRHPVSRAQPGNAVCIGGLTAGQQVTAQLVTVTNIGIESSATTFGNLELTIPSTKIDNIAPEAPDTLAVSIVPQGIALSWQTVSDDEFAYRVERSENGGAFTALDTVPCMGQLRSGGASISGQVAYLDRTAVTGVTYQWRVIVEDLSGNLSAPSAAVSLED